MAVGDTFESLEAAQAGAPATSKKVDANENTARFLQEIYNASGRLVSVHEKFPVDLGHKQL